MFGLVLFSHKMPLLTLLTLAMSAFRLFRFITQIVNLSNEIDLLQELEQLTVDQGAIARRSVAKPLSLISSFSLLLFNDFSELFSTF